MKKIPTIEEIRKTRREISRKCDNNPHRLITYYIEIQKQKSREKRIQYKT